MIEWLLTLALIGVMGLGSLAPGAAGTAIANQVASGLGPEARATAIVDADPVFDMPRGHYPHVDLDVTGAQLGPLPLAGLKVGLTDLWITGGNRLAQPAATKVRLVVREADAQAALLGMLGQVDVARLLPLKGLKPQLGDIDVKFTGGRVVASGVAKDFVSDRSWTFEASATPSFQGSSLRLGAPRLVLDGKAMPSMLLSIGLAQVRPLLTLDRAGLPGRDWVFTALKVEDGLLDLELAGVLTPEGLM